MLLALHDAENNKELAEARFAEFRLGYKAISP
jgi:hypothetical protein